MSAYSEQNHNKKSQEANFIREISKKSIEVQKFLANISNPFFKI